MQLKSILRLPATLARTGLSRSTTYALINKGQFPSPIQLSKRAVGWDSDAVSNWINARIKAGQERAVIACEGIATGEAVGRPTVTLEPIVSANRGSK